MYLELLLAMLQTARHRGSVKFEADRAGRVAPCLEELCRKAGCLIPKVIIRDGVTRAAAVGNSHGRTVLLMSGRFVDLLDDRELRAILAHEVIHVTRQDLNSLRRISWVTVIIGASVGGITAARYGGDYGLAICIFFGLLATIVARVFLSLFNRPLERRADVEGARLCDDPIALAAALDVARAFTEAARRRVYGPKPWRWLLSPLAWPLPSHPRIAGRISRLMSSAQVTSR
jgi:heat shock protein HtpX